ncbi:MAG: sigma-70 family RNA polymerase sigma factor [Phaeospirillum sp.]|nr:sigma-70 family RNA polymerase sigma factor [Phaeospirillum sp.]
MEALRADGFRRLRAYNGSSRIETFVALVTRDVLAERLLRLFQAHSATDGWTAFERFFAADINRIINRRLPGADRADLRQDAYQDICVALIADDYRRLKAYRGIGSFTGFVLHMVDRLLIDFIRSTMPLGRQRAEAQTTEWEDIPSDQPSPEDALLEQEGERLLSLASEVLREAAAALSETERLYLHIALGSGEPIPAREAARQMQRPVEEVYKLKQRVMTRLRETLDKHPAVKMWKASV